MLCLFCYFGLLGPSVVWLATSVVQMDSVRSLYLKVHKNATTMLTDGTIISIAPDFVEADQTLAK